MIGSLWVAGQQSPWSPNFQALPLTEKVIGATSGPVFEGAQLFHDKACLSCHLIQGHGGRRGPDLTYVGDKLSRDNIVIRIVNGGNNMPAFGSSLKPEEIDVLVAFLQSRKRPLRPQDRSPVHKTKSFNDGRTPIFALYRATQDDNNEIGCLSEE
jgi:ubiquinol-cytochrome c reductase cytochrome b subunit